MWFSNGMTARIDRGTIAVMEMEMMTPDEDDIHDDDVPEQALQALAKAQEAATLANLPQVLVRDGVLLRIHGESVTILKRLTGRKQVPPIAPSPQL
jgi:hypothetical protein